VHLQRYQSAGKVNLISGLNGQCRDISIKISETYFKGTSRRDYIGFEVTPLDETSLLLLFFIAYYVLSKKSL
jgi:hypothetical protein